MRRINLPIVYLILLIAGCTNRDTLVDKTTLLGKDYRLFQQTPAWDLAKAVQDGNVAEIKAEAIKNKALVDFKEGRYGQTLLRLAVVNENYTSVKTLLQLGANPNTQDSEYGASPLIKAAGLGSESSIADTSFLKILLKYGGNPNAIEYKTKYTPLMTACENGSFEYVKILLDAGANINYLSAYGDSPLYCASVYVSIYGHPELVTYLINRGANFKRVLYTTADSEKMYLTNALRDWRFQLGSDDYKKKMQLVEFLKKNGMDYREAKIPDRYLNDYSKAYLEKY
jgi:hypothetical protein